MKSIFSVIFSLCFVVCIFSQNTVGLQSINSTKVTDGYSLFYPNSQSDLFLINNCGELINKWEGTQSNRPGFANYLLPDGNLLTASLNGPILPSSFGAGGAGGYIEIIDWDGNPVWSYILADTEKRQHHDVHYMPNGNVLAIVWEKYLLEDIVNIGFDTLNNNQVQLWCDAIYEINPSNDSLEWGWRSWDHLIQDIDSSKLNYGVIEDHPERINVKLSRVQFWSPRLDAQQCIRL